MKDKIWLAAFGLCFLLNLHVQLFLLRLSMHYWYLFPLALIGFYLVQREYELKIPESRNIYLTVISALLLFILFRAGLFSPGPINVQDYPLHYFVTHKLAHDLLPCFGSTVGPTQHFQLGYTLLFDYPVLAPSTAAFLFYLLQTVPLWATFRFVVLVSFSLPVFGIYLLSERLGLQSRWAFLASVLSLSWSNSHLVSGMFSSYLSLGLGLFSLCLLLDYFDSGETYRVTTSSLVLALSFLSHSLVFVPLLIVHLSLIVSNRGNISRRDLALFLLIFMAISILYPVAVLNRLDYIEYIFSRAPDVFVHLYEIDYVFWNNFYVQSSLVVLLSMPVLVMRYKNRYMDAILYSAILLLSLTFALNYVQTVLNNGTVLNIFANAFQVDRIIFSSRPLWAIISSFSIAAFFRNKGKPFNISKSVVFGSLVLFIVPYIVYMSESWHYSEDMNSVLLHDHTLGAYFTIDYTDGIFEFNPNQDVMQTYSFLSNNTDNSARVLWEESLYGRLGGNIKSMAPLFTNRLFVGGLYIGVMLEGNEGAYDGMFFGKNIADYDEAEIHDKLEEFNVGWVVVWTGVSKQYFETHTSFERIYLSPSGLLAVYNYTGSEREFVLSGDAEITNISEARIKLRVEKPSELLLSFRYEPDWHAYSGDEEIEIYREGVLMSMTAPAGEVEIVYEENPLTWVAKHITLFSFSISLLLSVYLFKKGRATTS